MSGYTNGRYWRAPSNCLNWLGPRWGEPIDLNKWEPTTIGVAIGLHSDILAFFRNSTMYHCCEKSKPSVVEETSIPWK